jgi:MinD superfamily P-loop ATPase
VKEAVIISGKGGTGKTSVTASFACLAGNQALADCDVDAADLHILVHPEVIHEEEFRGGIKARIDDEKCVQCGKCREVCRFDAISEALVVNPLYCEGCGVCFHFCPEDAVVLDECLNGHWFISNTRFGPMVHAALLPGEENSGKLVALVRNQAKVLAAKQDKRLILVDGAPGVGCPVISSVTGADHVVIVTEPTLSGLHDMERAMQLVRGFDIPISVLVNKADINTEVTERIEEVSERAGAVLLGRVPYDPAVTSALVKRKCVVEENNSPASAAVKHAWDKLRSILDV